MFRDTEKKYNAIANEIKSNSFHLSIGTSRHFKYCAKIIEPNPKNLELICFLFATELSNGNDFR